MDSPLSWRTSGAVLLAILAICIAIGWRVRRLAAIHRRHTAERSGKHERLDPEWHDKLLREFQGLMLHFHAATQEVPHTLHARKLLEDVINRGDLVIAEARDRVDGMSQHGSVHRDLLYCLQKLGVELNDNNEVTYVVEESGKWREIYAHVSEGLLHVGREAVTNAFRHAQAEKIQVTLAFERRVLVLRVRDDGCGFHPVPSIDPDGSHWGLLGMMERAHRINARFECKSVPGSGTQINVSVPARHAYPSAPNVWDMAWARVRDAIGLRVPPGK